MSEFESAARPQPTPGLIFEAGQPLLERFKIAVDPYVDPDAFIAATDSMNPSRKADGTYKVRFELEEDEHEWPKDVQEKIHTAAEDMGLLHEQTPLIGKFDAVVVLGGARQSNLDRTRYAADAITAKQARVGHVIVAGTMRPLNDLEKENVANYAPGAETEFGLCVGAGLTVADEVPDLMPSFVKLHSQLGGTPAVLDRVMSALSSRELLTERSRIGAVVTQIYQPSTALDLTRIARRYGVSRTLAAGNPSDPNIVAKRTPATYLNEVIRTLHAAAFFTKEDSERQANVQRIAARLDPVAKQ